MSGSRFWRASESSLTFFGSVPSEIQKIVGGNFKKLVKGHGIIVGDLNVTTDCGEVDWTGVVEEVSPNEFSVRVNWRNSDFVLKPTDAGRVYWRKKDWFNFASDVANRYMLDAIFADIFDDGEWRKTRTRVVLSPKETHKYDPASQVDADSAGDTANDELKGLPVVSGSRSPTVGYVYLVWSMYGYKIGKAVNVPKRTKLFEVKLPFPIRVEHYAMFSDYTQAERSLHLHFHEKRLEGEWFALTNEDISFIKTFGRPMTDV